MATYAVWFLTWLGCVVAGEDAYGYEDVVPRYCNIEKDWGPLPDKPPKGAAKLLQVQAFTHPGARAQRSGQFCWEKGEAGRFDCNQHGLSAMIPAEEKRPDLLKQTFYRTQVVEADSGLQGSCLGGQIVEDGTQMEQNNGKRLRVAYIEKAKLLPESLKDLSDEQIDRLMRFRSTNVPIAEQSTMAVISGIYPREHLQDHQTLPMFISDPSTDVMLPTATRCDAVRRVTGEFLAEHSRKDDLLEECRRFNPDGNFQEMSWCLKYIRHLMDCIMSRMCPTVPFSHHNKTLPEVILQNGGSHFKYLWELYDQSEHDIMMELLQVGGVWPLADAVLGYVTQATSADKQPFQKFILWTGRTEGPVMPLMMAFDLKKHGPSVVGFGSMVVLELWEGAEGHTVRWIVNGQVIREEPIGEFKTQAQAIIDKKEYCTALLPTTSGWTPSYPPDQSPSDLPIWAVSLISAVSGFAGAVCVVAVPIFFHYSKKVEDQEVQNVIELAGPSSTLRTTTSVTTGMA